MPWRECYKMDERLKFVAPITHTVLAGIEVGREDTENLRNNSTFSTTPACAGRSQRCPRAPTPVLVMEHVSVHAQVACWPRRHPPG